MPKSMKPIDTAERAKIAELQQDTQKDSTKLEWLYSGNKVDTNSYLLGKPIDKLLTESQNEAQAASSLAYSSTIDLASKIREDPLFEIKRQEIEAKKKLLENPIRLKQLKEMISKSSSHDKKKSRSRKQRYSRSRSRSRSRRQRYSRSRSRSRSHYTRYKQSQSRSRSPIQNDGYYGYNRRKEKSQSPEDSRKKEKIEEINRVKKKIDDLKKIRDFKKPKEDFKQVSHKMTDEEKKRKLEEMSSNAKWRNELRDKNIKKHELQEKLENAKEKDNRYGHTDVFNSMMRDAYVSTEDRIKRNIKNIQRNTSEYEKNFARK